MASITSRILTRNAAVWALRILVGGMFLLSGVMNLTGQPMMVDTFDKVGLGQWLRMVTGLLEVAGGAAVLIPSLSVLGAVVLLAVDAGAFVAQVTVLHQDWIHCIVIGAVLVALIVLQPERWPLAPRRSAGLA
ncbi:MAG: DoxX family protein [Alsobacter sp.]